MLGLLEDQADRSHSKLIEMHTAGAKQCAAERDRQADAKRFLIPSDTICRSAAHNPFDAGTRT
jgi:hypothetical protein